MSRTRTNPINEHGDTTITVSAGTRLLRDLGLAYETTYTYKVRTLVHYKSNSVVYSGAVADWWNSLDCVMMNDLVEDHVGDGPAIRPRHGYDRPLLLHVRRPCGPMLRQW